MATKKKQAKRPKPPVVIENGAALLKIGVVVDACCRGLYMLPSTAEQAGFKIGDFLQVDHDDGGTVIVRRLAHCVQSGQMRHNYVYMDEQSASYLETELHDDVRVKRSEYDMESP